MVGVAIVERLSAGEAVLSYQPDDQIPPGQRHLESPDHIWSYPSVGRRMVVVCSCGWGGPEGKPKRYWNLHAQPYHREHVELSQKVQKSQKGVDRDPPAP